MFKSHMKSAMNDELAWEALVSLMNDLCSTLDKSKAINHVLLEELKIHKISDSILVKHESDSELKLSADNTNEVQEDDNKLSEEVKIEIVEDFHENSEDDNEEQNDGNYDLEEVLENKSDIVEDTMRTPLKGGGINFKKPI